MALNDAQLDRLAEVRDQISEIISTAETVMNLPDEVVLPKDELCLVFNFLSSADLAQAAQACCHFDGAAQDVVKQRIDGMFSDKFELYYHARPALRFGGRYTSRLLRVLEHEMQRTLVLINSLDGSMKDVDFGVCDTAADVLDELKEFHRHVLRAQTPLIISKLAGLKASPNRKKMVELRSEVWQLIPMRSPTPVEPDTPLYDALAQAIAPELRQVSARPEKCFGPWAVFIAMPPAFIESQQTSIFRQLATEDSCVSHMALSALQQLPRDALVRIGAEPRLTAFIESSGDRDDKKYARRILATIHSDPV